MTAKRKAKSKTRGGKSKFQPGKLIAGWSKDLTRSLNQLKGQWKKLVPSKQLKAFKSFKPFKFLKSKRAKQWKPVAVGVPVAVLAFALAMMFKGSPTANRKVATQSFDYKPAVISAKLATQFEAAGKEDLANRIAFWAQAIMAKPDLISSTLGKGPVLEDTAPLFVDRYDCTTYVETVAALAKSTGTEDLVKNLIAIRYKDGKVGYESRNHFPEADWIPNNTSAGNLKDITSVVAKESGIKVAYAKKTLHKQAWFRKQQNPYASRALASVAEDTKVEVPYIPIDQVGKVIYSLPQGAVVNFVREDRSTQPVLITHQGFIVWKDKKVYFQHATHEKEVSQVRFFEYVKKMKAQLPWKVIGINVNQFQG